MPIEIRELIIKTTVRDEVEESGNGNTKSLNTSEIVAACVDKVMELLEEKAER